MSVREDLFEETFLLLLVSQCSSVWMLSCSCVAAVSYFGCCESTVRSSAYDMEWVFGWVGVLVGMSCMNKMNSVGERTEPCRTPFV